MRWYHKYVVFKTWKKGDTASRGIVTTDARPDIVELLTLLPRECATQSDSPILESLGDHGARGGPKLELFRVPGRWSVSCRWRETRMERTEMRG